MSLEDEKTKPVKPQFQLVRGRLIDEQGFPRRNCVLDMTSEELTLQAAIDQVEKIGAHPLLTEAVILIGQAKDKLSDYIDNNTGYIEKNR